MRNEAWQTGSTHKAPMLARSLKEVGYATGHFGKWHMGGQSDVTDASSITDYGFDESLTNFEGMGAKLLPLTKDETGKIGRIWEKAEILGEPVTWMQRSEITNGFIDAAIPFMEKAQREGKPFYVNIWPDDVHSPYWPPYEDYGHCKRSRQKRIISCCFGSNGRSVWSTFQLHPGIMKTYVKTR